MGTLTDRRWIQRQTYRGRMRGLGCRAFGGRTLPFQPYHVPAERLQGDLQPSRVHDAALAGAGRDLVGRALRVDGVDVVVVQNDVFFHRKIAKSPRVAGEQEIVGQGAVRCV